MDMFETKKERGYIARLRNDPRLRAVLDGMVAQTVIELEAQRPMHNMRPSEIATRSAEAAIIKAMAFVLDNDGEYQMVCEDRDRILENALTFANTTPQPFVLKLKD